MRKLNIRKRTDAIYVSISSGFTWHALSLSWDKKISNIIIHNTDCYTYMHANIVHLNISKADDTYPK